MIILKRFLVIAILSLMWSCDGSKQGVLRLYEVCLMGETKNRLIVPVSIKDNAPYKVNVCADEQTEFKIFTLKEVQVKYYERKGNKLVFIKGRDIEIMKLDTSKNIYAIIFLYLAEPDINKYKEWLEKREFQKEIIITFNNQAINTFYIQGTINATFIRVNIGDALDEVDKLYRGFVVLTSQRGQA